MPQNSTAAEASPRTSLVGEIVGDRFALVDEIGPDGVAFRYLAFDTLEQRELELRVIPRSKPAEPYWFEVVDPASTARPPEASAPPPTPVALNRVKDAVVPEPVPGPSASPRDFGQVESAWFEQGETLEQEQPLEWLETDVDKPSQSLLRDGPFAPQDTPERPYALSWASAVADD